MASLWYHRTREFGTPEFSEGPVHRLLFGDLIDVPASPGWWTVEGAGPRVRRPWVGSQLCHCVWPAQLPAWAAAVSSLAKREDWTNPQAGLKSLTVSRPLELYHPGSCQKLGSPILSQQGLHSHPRRGLRGRGCPACGGGVSLRGRARVSGSLQGLIPGAVSAETLCRAPLPYSGLSFLPRGVQSAAESRAQHLKACPRETGLRHCCQLQGPLPGPLEKRSFTSPTIRSLPTLKNPVIFHV